MINVDFGGAPETSKVGPAAYGEQANDLWNTYERRSDPQLGFVGNGVISNLRRAEGTLSGATMSVENGPGAWGNGAADPMYEGYIYQFDGQPLKVTFTGLGRGTYDIYVYGHGGPDADTVNSSFELFRDGISFGRKSTTKEAGWRSPTWHEGDQYVLFRAVSLDVGTVLSLHVTPDGLWWAGALAGIQLVRNPNSWLLSGSLQQGRFIHTSTLMADGRVLVAGGYTASGGAINTAEVFDPTAGTWTQTRNMSATRYYHVSALLPNGKVLVAGGYHNGIWLSSAEVFDPASGSWGSVGSLVMGRSASTATVLPDGRVLVAGGGNGNGGGEGFGGVTTTEIFDPATGTWTTTGSLNQRRYLHQATLLADGRVLVTGGTSNEFDPGGPRSSAEIYDSRTGKWTLTGPMASARYQHESILLPNGKVLVAGGNRGYYGSADILASAEVFDPATGAWASAGSMNEKRHVAASVFTSNGIILVTGGSDGIKTAASTEAYDPGSNTWRSAESLGIARSGHTATRLRDGSVMVAGGYNGADVARSEILVSRSPARYGGGITALQSWRLEHFNTLADLGEASVSANPSGDGLSNLEKFAFGLDPSVPIRNRLLIAANGMVVRGKPNVGILSTPTTFGYFARFIRRRNHQADRLTYTAEFSADLTSWQPSNVVPRVIASDEEFDVVEVPYPLFIHGKKAGFFRVRVVLER